MRIFNVKDFGAKGDGQALDTEAFNAAVEKAAQCHGKVFVPNGEYLLGSVRLKSNICFEMAEEAVLRGSDNIEDYSLLPYDAENKYCTEKDGPYGCFFKHSLLYVYEAENVQIIGGKILFNDLAFDEKRPLNPIILDEDYIQGVGYIRQPSHYYFPKTRPTALYVSKSNNIAVKEVFFEKSPGFSVWVLNSEQLLFKSVKIRNSKYQWNGDGLHFSACRNVEVTDCDIDASDDCVAIDGNYGGQSYHITVKNCLLKTTMHVVRLYTGLDFGTEESCGGDYEKFAVHDIKITDCKVADGGGVLLFCAFDGAIYNVEIENLTCKQFYEGTAIAMSAKAGEIRGIQIKNCTFDCNGIGYYAADKNGRIENVELGNCVFTVMPKTKIWGDDYSEVVATHSLSMPYGMVCKNVKQLILNKINIRWKKAAFSNGLALDLQNRMKERIGAERLAQIEPKYIQALTSINSTINTINCNISDYEEKI